MLSINDPDVDILFKEKCVIPGSLRVRRIIARKDLVVYGELIETRSSITVKGDLVGDKEKTKIISGKDIRIGGLIRAAEIKAKVLGAEEIDTKEIFASSIVTNKINEDINKIRGGVWKKDP